MGCLFCVGAYYPDFTVYIHTYKHNLRLRPQQCLPCWHKYVLHTKAFGNYSVVLCYIIVSPQSCLPVPTVLVSSQQICTQHSICPPPYCRMNATVLLVPCTIVSQPVRKKVERYTTKRVKGGREEGKVERYTIKSNEIEAFLSETCVRMMDWLLHCRSTITATCNVTTVDLPSTLFAYLYYVLPSAWFIYCIPKQ